MERVNILVEALPYIKQFYNKKVMIKYGGHAMVDEEAMASTASDTVLLKYVGMQPIVVHGGGPEITKSMKKLGKDPKFIKGLRVTDEETMAIVKMVLVGKINTDIVSQICLHNGKGAGLSGKDNKLIQACKKIHRIKDEETGEIEEIDLGYVGEINFNVTDIGSMTLHVGANQNQNMEVRIAAVTTEFMYIDDLNVTRKNGPEDALDSLDVALNYVTAVRSQLGAYENRLEHTTKSLDTTEENMTSAISRVEDADMATTMVEYTKLNVLEQAGTSALAQANELPQLALQLLQ